MYDSENVFQFLHRGGYLNRWHTIPRLREHSLGQHSWGVAMLAEYVTNGAASKSLILKALTHDLAEMDLGDVPSPAKRQLPEFSKLEERWEAERDIDHPLTSQEELVLKACDQLEFLGAVAHESSMGNRHEHLDLCWVRGSQYFRETLRSLERLSFFTYANRAQDMYDHFEDTRNAAR